MKASRKRNRTTEHRYVEERLSAYLDDQLSPREQKAVRQHLTACQECQWNLSTLQQTAEWTRALPRIPAPRVFTVPAPAQVVPAPRRRWGFVPVLQGAAALVALLLVFTLAGDFMLGSLLPASVPQQAVMLDQAPAALQVTAVVLEVEEETVVEVPVSESEPAVMPQMGDLTSEPALGEAEEARSEADLGSGAEGQAAEQPAMAATAVPEDEQARALAVEPPRVKESAVTTAMEAVEASTTLPPEAPVMEEAGAAETGERATPTTDVASTTVATVVAALPPTEAPPVLAPTTVAQVPAPAPVSAEAPTAVWQQLSASPLRFVEVGLAILVIFLGTLAILATILQRMRR